jgi:hypothetical protein
MIDRDKKELNYLNECQVVVIYDNLILWKHKEKQHFIIQLNPPLEKWVTQILHSDNKTMEDFGYPKDFKKLKSALKEDIDDENDVKLNILLDAVLSSSNPVIKKLEKILLHLRDKTYEADINELKNV